MKYLKIFNNAKLFRNAKLYKDSLYLYTGDTSTENAGGLITELEAPIHCSKEDLMTIYENYCIIGALLSKDGNTWTIWNTNPDEVNYWDPKSDTITTPSTQYGEVIAVCVGRGLWAKIGWYGLTTNMKWASSNSDVLYTTCHGINIHGNGWESTQHIRTHNDANLTGTIWAALEANEYIPSKYELLEIHNNCCDNNHCVDNSDNSDHTFNKNLGKLLRLSTDKYWSSSLYTDDAGDYGIAFFVYFNNGDSSATDVTFDYRSVALLHF